MNTSGRGMRQRRVVTGGAAETRALAAEILRECGGRGVLALHGELGSGKTCFVQGLAAAVGVSEAVTSPTYIMVNEYAGRCRLYHMDLYRIERPSDVLGVGLDEYLDDPDAVLAIEWAERADGYLPDRTIHVTFERGGGPDERRVTILMPEEEG